MDYFLGKRTVIFGIPKGTKGSVTMDFYLNNLWHMKLKLSWGSGFCFYPQMGKSFEELFGLCIAARNLV